MQGLPRAPVPASTRTLAVAGQARLGRAAKVDLARLGAGRRTQGRAAPTGAPLVASVVALAHPFGDRPTGCTRLLPNLPHAISLSGARACEHTRAIFKVLVADFPILEVTGRTVSSRSTSRRTSIARNTGRGSAIRASPGVGNSLPTPRCGRGTSRRSATTKGSNWRSPASTCGRSRTTRRAGSANSGSCWSGNGSYSSSVRFSC